EMKVAAGEFYWARWLIEIKSNGSFAKPIPLEQADYMWRPDSEALLVDCDSETMEIATAPDWTTQEYPSGCPAWSGLKPGEGRRPVSYSLTGHSNQLR
ncbi:MAG: hypothetical protein ACC700_10960, partial [Anaerolineales bacterium]